MWTTLVGLIERWWREKPRQDVVRSVVFLRESMLHCQRAYTQYQDEFIRGERSSDAAVDARMEWIRALASLTTAVEGLDDVLSIFSPEARDKISSYVALESLILTPHPLTDAAEALHQPSDIDLEGGELGDTFEDALEQLRIFIQDHFKPEEIHAASSSWR